MDEQKRLFEIIRSKLVDQQRLSETVAKMLGITQNSTYRRIRCEQELTFTEFQTLCRNFGVSMDEIAYYKSNQGALFHYMPDITDQESYINHVVKMADILNFDSESVGNELICMAQNIPFYHFAKYPELAFFRLFAWNDTLKRRNLSYSQFCSNLDKDKITFTFKQINHAFVHASSKEIWTERTIDTTLRTLEYYFDIGAFDSDDEFMFLLDQLTDLLDTLKYYANDGYKEKMPFALYLCSVEVENNIMMIRKGNNLSCLVQLHAINRIVTENENICNDTQKWIDSLILKSIKISGSSSFRERHHFFRILEGKVQSLRDKVKKS